VYLQKIGMLPFVFCFCFIISILPGYRRFFEKLIDPFGSQFFALCRLER